jgi:hypothetical protein
MHERYLVDNFSHRVGYHCESSSMRDLLEFYWLPMSEAMVFGLNGTMGFSFFDFSERFTGGDLSDLPIFVGGKQDTITPNSLACRLLGITLKKQSFTNPDKAWERSKEKILKDNPLMLQLDLGYLNYLQEEELKGDEFIHFGGHFVTLAGFDMDKRIAYIGDSQYEGFQEVPIELLKKARNSTYGPSFFHPKNAQFFMEPREDGKHPPLAAGVKLSIKKVIDNMLRPSMSSDGIQGMKNFSENILEWNEKLKGTFKHSSFGKEMSLAEFTFEIIHGYIEEWGTGGALFRNLYRSFLKAILNNPEIKQGPRAWNKDELGIINTCLPLITDSAAKWTDFAKILKNASNNHKENCIEYVNLSELSQKIREISLLEEKLFRNLYKIKL